MFAYIAFAVRVQVTETLRLMNKMLKSFEVCKVKSVHNHGEMKWFCEQPKIFTAC